MSLKPALALALCALAATLAIARARADDAPRITILEENDSLYFHSDKHYTQGLRLSWLSPALSAESGWNGAFALAGDVAPVFAPDGNARRDALFLGQSIFTPHNLRLAAPNPRDRPYAGWLYAGTSLLQETNHAMLENLELDVGIVGPAALGKQVQNDWHQFIGIAQAKGWGHQIQNEPGLVLSYERMWRLGLVGNGGSDIGVDAVPQLGATIGNVFTYGDAGGLIRVGHNLDADYGPAHVRPAPSGTDYFDSDALFGRLGYYFYIGVQGRVVGRNIFLDGNSFRHSPSVPKKVLVADLVTGFSLFWSSALRVDLSVGRRTEEFVGQHGPDVLGSAAVAFDW